MQNGSVQEEYYLLDKLGERLQHIYEKVLPKNIKLKSYSMKEASCASPLLGVIFFLAT